MNPHQRVSSQTAHRSSMSSSFRQFWKQFIHRLTSPLQYYYWSPRGYRTTPNPPRGKGKVFTGFSSFALSFVSSSSSFAISSASFRASSRHVSFSSYETLKSVCFLTKTMDIYILSLAPGPAHSMCKANDFGIVMTRVHSSLRSFA